LTIPAGGSSTVAGVYYQMLWCLLRSLQLRIGRPISASGGTSGLLVLEPKNGGGDVRVISEVTEIDGDGSRNRILELGRCNRLSAMFCRICF